MKQTYDCKIIKHEVLNEEIFKLVFDKVEGMPEIRPGQFFGIKVSDSAIPLLKRPISVSLVTDTTIEFTVKVNGEGTQLLKDRKVGDVLNLLGPLGNGFYLDNISSNSLIVGGGIGVAPVKELTRVMNEKLEKSVPVILGFRNEPFELNEFEKYSNDIKIATESGVVGHKGYVTDVLKEALEANKYDMVYVCGPHVMIEAVNNLCSSYNVETQLLMEERMACGIGACLVCTCAIKEGNEVKNKRVCKDGPVFYGSEVVF